MPIDALGVPIVALRVAIAAPVAAGATRATSRVVLCVHRERFSVRLEARSTRARSRCEHVARPSERLVQLLPWPELPSDISYDEEDAGRMVEALPESLERAFALHVTVIFRR